MADRFADLTPAARTALATAERAAARLHGGQIDAIHILLGLVADPASAAAQALGDLRLTTKAIWGGARAAVHQPGRAPGLTPGARSALRAAISVARRHGQARVGTLHLLAGVLAEPAPAVARTLGQLGLSPAAARAALDVLLAGDAGWLDAEIGAR